MPTAGRVRLRRQGPGGQILRHTDKGGWATRLHRIHVPVVTNDAVRFLMMAPSGAFLPLPVAPGDAFEINNAIPHRVDNSRELERVHLLLDVGERPMECAELRPGQRCLYNGGAGVTC